MSFLLTDSSVDVPVLGDIYSLSITSSIPYPCTDALNKLYEDYNNEHRYLTSSRELEITSCEPSIVSPSASPVSSEGDSADDGGKGLPQGAKVGIAICCVVGALVILVIFFMAVRGKVGQRVFNEGDGTSGGGTGGGTEGDGAIKPGGDGNAPLPPPYSREPMPEETVVSR
jgi:hypothetical protein